MDVQSEKVIVLVDMDCFYVQVEKGLNPELRGKPCAIVQYNKWKGGSIIAVDYEARKYGVTRSVKGDEAKLRCPNICLAKVPEKRGKADLSNYRKASVQVMKVLSRFTSVIERASIDEAFLDLTQPVKTYISHHHLNQQLIDYSKLYQSTHVAVTGNSKAEQHKPIDSVVNELETSGNSSNNMEAQNCTKPVQDSIDVSSSLHYEISSIREWINNLSDDIDIKLAVGALLAQQIRDAVLAETGYTCSAGISFNKMLAKLAAGMNKPNQQTVLPKTYVNNVFLNTPFKKVRHLGGKLGQEIQNSLGISHVGQLQEYSLKTLQTKFGNKTGLWLYDVCRGKCEEQLTNRTITKSIGCGKNFTGPSKLTTYKMVRYWLEQLSEELVERLEEDITENSRRAQSLTVHFLLEGASSSLTRSLPLPTSNAYDVQYIVANSWEAINRGQKPVTNEDSCLSWTTGILNIHLSAGKFISCSKGKMKSLLSVMEPTISPTKSSSDVQSTSPTKSSSSVQSDLGNTSMEVCTSRSSECTSKDSVGIARFFTPMKRKHTQEVDSFFCRDQSGTNDKLFTGEDNQFESTVCSVCGDNILRLLIEEHMDYHIAMTLLTPSHSNT